MSIGLVLEGGAMRGMYTAGVLDTWMDHHIPVDSIVGTSAGALFGVNLLSEQKGRVIRYNKRFNQDKRYMGLLPLLKEGNIVSPSFAYDIVPRTLDIFDDTTFQNSSIPFYAVVTNITTGQPEYHQIKSVFDQMETLRASGSMPFVSKPVSIEGQRYLDGGITDSIPFLWLSQQGYDKLVVILTRDMTYRKTPMSSAMIRLFYRNYPNLAAQLAQRHAIYNQSVELLSQWEAQGKAFVIRPSKPIEISRMEKDPKQLQVVYDLGVSDMQHLLSDLLKYLT